MTFIRKQRPGNNGAKWDTIPDKIASLSKGFHGAAPTESYVLSPRKEPGAVYFMRATLLPILLRFKSAICSTLSEISFKHLKSPEFARMDKKATTTAAKGAFWFDSDRSHGAPGDDIPTVKSKMLW